MAAKKAAKSGKQKETSAKVRKAKPVSPAKAKREARLDLFIAEYLVDLNGRRAAIEAGYSPDSARCQASKLLALPDVQERVAQAMVERATRTSITSDRVLERLWGIATADPRELIELHRGCCRYCWGEGNRYQRTPRELDEARMEYQALDDAERARTPDPDEQGGIGYNPKRDPNPACPECFGDGVERVMPKDTRDLSPTARLLYAGVKQTQHGLQILTHDQKGALVDIGKHLGLFREKFEVSMPSNFEDTLLAARKRALSGGDGNQ